MILNLKTASEWKLNKKLENRFEIWYTLFSEGNMKIDYMTREKCRRELTYAKENLQRGYEFYLQGDYANATFYINSSKTAYEWVHQVGEEFNDRELLKLSEEGLVYLKRVADEVTTLTESERQ